MSKNLIRRVADMAELQRTVSELREERATLKKQHREESVKLVNIVREQYQKECAEMKKENERLRERIEGYEFGNQFKDSPFIEANRLKKQLEVIKEVADRNLRAFDQVQGENEELRKQIERLKAGLEKIIAFDPEGNKMKWVQIVNHIQTLAHVTLNPANHDTINKP